MPDTNFDRTKLEQSLARGLGGFFNDRLIYWLGATTALTKNGFSQKFLTDEENALAALLLLHQMKATRASVEREIRALRLPKDEADAMLVKLEAQAVAKVQAAAQRQARQIVRNTADTLKAERLVLRGDDDAAGSRLRDLFNPARREGIAITSTTSSKTAGIVLVAKMLEADGWEVERIWRTARDTHVCPICEPYDGKPESVWGREFPRGTPAHTRCRCDIELVTRRKRK